MQVSWDDLLTAFQLSTFGLPGEHQAFLCKETGNIYWHSEFSDELDDLPDDIDDDEKYLPFPDKRELGLGKPLALEFTSEFLPNAVNEVRRIFSRKAA